MHYIWQHLMLYSIMWTIWYVCSFCRFTAGVDELIWVLKDLQVGTYQRTTISSKGQDKGVCFLCLT